MDRELNELGEQVGAALKNNELVYKGRLIAYGNLQQDTENMVVYAATAIHQTYWHGMRI